MRTFADLLATIHNNPPVRSQYQPLDPAEGYLCPGDDAPAVWRRPAMPERGLPLPDYRCPACWERLPEK